MEIKLDKNYFHKTNSLSYGFYRQGPSQTNLKNYLLTAAFVSAIAIDETLLPRFTFFF